MSNKRDDASVVAVGAAACVACCVGPILAVLAAIGIGTAASGLLFGAIGLVVAAIVTILLVGRRRRRAAGCAATAEPVPVALSKMSAPR